MTYYNWFHFCISVKFAVLSTNQPWLWPDPPIQINLYHSVKGMGDHAILPRVMIWVSTYHIRTGTETLWLQWNRHWQFYQKDLNGKLSISGQSRIILASGVIEDKISSIKSSAKRLSKPLIHLIVTLACLV